jgi:hypothetical protein
MKKGCQRRKLTFVEGTEVIIKTARWTRAGGGSKEDFEMAVDEYRASPTTGWNDATNRRMPLQTGGVQGHSQVDVCLVNPPLGGGLGLETFDQSVLVL